MPQAALTWCRARAKWAKCGARGPPCSQVGAAGSARGVGGCQAPQRSRGRALQVLLLAAASGAPPRLSATRVCQPCLLTMRAQATLATRPPRAPRSWPAAGCAPGTWPWWRPMATCGSWTGARTWCVRVHASTAADGQHAWLACHWQGSARGAPPPLSSAAPASRRAHLLTGCCRLRCPQILCGGENVYCTEVSRWGRAACSATPRLSATMAPWHRAGSHASLTQWHSECHSEPLNQWHSECHSVSDAWLPARRRAASRCRICWPSNGPASARACPPMHARLATRRWRLCWWPTPTWHRPLCLAWPASSWGRWWRLPSRWWRPCSSSSSSRAWLWRCRRGAGSAWHSTKCPRR